MPMDLDYVAAKVTIEELQELLNSLPHGQRESLANDIIEFVDSMQEKYAK